MSYSHASLRIYTIKSKQKEKKPTLWSYVFCGEMAFILFVIAGSTPLTLPFFPASLSLTKIFMAISMLTVLKRVIVNKQSMMLRSSIWEIYFYILFSCVLLASLIFTDSPLYGGYKVSVFITMTAWAFIGMLWIGRDLVSIDKFIKAFIIVATVASLFSIYSYLKGYNEYLNTGWTMVQREGIAGGNPIALGRVAGIGAIMTLILFVTNRTRKSVYFFGVLLTGIMVAGMLISGSRMPVLTFSCIVIMLAMLTSISIDVVRKKMFIQNSALRMVLIFLFLPIILFPMYQGGYLNPIKERLTSLVSDTATDASAHQSTQERQVRYKVAYDMFEQAPFLGNGVGSFATTYNGLDEKDYPHNIFLEIMAETGLLGLITFMLLLITCLIAMFKSKLDKVYKTCLIASFLFIFLNANVTGDLNDNRILFAFLAAATAFSAAKKTEVQ